MRLFYKLVCIFTAAALLCCGFCIAPAALGEDWLFIDGENITRDVDMAVVYFDMETTQQSKWGYNVILNSEGLVTGIIESGNAQGENLAIPEGGWVVSASGVKKDWLEDKVSVGDRLYYDGYTQRLFVTDGEGEFNPYFNVELAVSRFKDGYLINEGAETSNGIEFSYNVTIDAQGYVIARGTEVPLPEGGFRIYAFGRKDRNKLISYAPLGGQCVVTDGLASFVYQEDLLGKSIELALAELNRGISEIKGGFDYVNYEELDAVALEAAAVAEGDLDYITVTQTLLKLLRQSAIIGSEDMAREHRAAFHTPTEKSLSEVRATVISAKAAGLNSIILRIPNGYGTYIPLPQGDKFAQSSSFDGFDLLKAYIEVCENESVSLTLCVDVYYNESASVAASNWCSEAMVKGNGLESKYFSPANTEFKEYFIDYIEYIVSNYDIKSLMFDSLRYPKAIDDCDLGYDYGTIERFNYESEIPVTEINEIRTLKSESPHWDAWNDFRTDLVSDMAKSVTDAVKAIDNGITLLVVSERDTVNSFYKQECTQWVDEGLFDGICVAVYERDKDENAPLNENGYYDGIVADKGYLFTNDEKYLFMGLECSGGVSSHRLGLAVNECRELGADGFIFSDLKAFINQNHGGYLSDGALRGSTVNAFDVSTEAIKDILEFSRIKIHDLVLKNGGCDDATYTAASELIEAAIQLAQQGEFNYDAVKKLEGDLSVLFAVSPAKSSVLKEYQALAKAFLLAKQQPQSDEDPSTPDTSDSSQGEVSDQSEVSDDISQEASDSWSDSSVGGADDSEVDVEQGGFSINFGSILIYGFVIIAAGAVIAAVTVSIIRKRKAPKGHHMPKGSQSGYGKEKDK